MDLNPSQKRERNRCFRMGYVARVQGNSVCPFIRGGHSVNASEADEPDRYIQTVPYMRGGWMAGYEAATSKVSDA